MVIVHREGKPPQFIECGTREEAEDVLKIAALVGNRDVNGDTCTFEIAEYEETPL
jgi:hypothetical protein